eukprot:TRINITY_DN1190_c0_g1_i1.p1 TRINITY_DN1190_c0_g1~~TRINITY_DN1190_c0_g1_i1.p1  ORF type:complete len:300 (+),score=62.59 TRINITY_DN1190_c0_g1_i1:766-1665(+)
MAEVQLSSFVVRRSVLVVGLMGTGKSAFCNLLGAWNPDHFKSGISEDGNGITLECDAAFVPENSLIFQEGLTKVDNLRVIDSPGFDDLHLGFYGWRATIGKALRKLAQEQSMGPNVVILTVKVDNSGRVGMLFPATLKFLMNALGRDILSHLVVVVTGVDPLNAFGDENNPMLLEMKRGYNNFITSVTASFKSFTGAQNVYVFPVSKWLGYSQGPLQQLHQLIYEKTSAFESPLLRNAAAMFRQQGPKAALQKIYTDAAECIADYWRDLTGARISTDAASLWDSAWDDDKADQDEDMNN